VNIEISAPISGGKIKSVASKSQTHRMLICAALADGDTFIRCGDSSDDINATVCCLTSLGASISQDGEGFRVGPMVRPLPGNGTIAQHCYESSSTLRFMLPICCALGVTTEFIMDGRLAEKPVTPLLAELTSHGCEIIKAYDPISPYGDQPAPQRRPGGGAAGARAGEQGPQVKSYCILKCSGKLSSGVFELSGNESSPFISGLLIALSLLRDDSVLCVAGREESRPYIAMTLEALGMFGLRVKRFATNPGRGAAFGIAGSQRYVSPGTVGIEGDWSNAAFWLCAGAIGGQGVTCTGLNTGSTQGDMAIMRLLERYGANVSYEGDSVTVAPGKLRGIQIDAIDTPDLVPALSVVASVAEGETVIYNAKLLKAKASDRLYAVKETLRSLGADVSETQDGLIIKGRRSLQGGTVPSYNDHRIAMMASIASMVCENPVTINDAEAVNRSYPGFFRDFKALGGQIADSRRDILPTQPR